MTNEIQRYHVGNRLSEIAVHNGVVYLAGIVPSKPTWSGSILEQTKDVLAQTDQLLAEVNSDKKHILRVQIYLADIKKIGQMNEVWDQWVAPGHTPPRATVRAPLANPDYHIEIVVTAAVSAD